MARKNTLTKFLEDIIDNSKDLVDDLIDRAKDVEDDVRDAAGNVVDNDDTPSTDELKDLRAALVGLTAKVDQLASAQSKSGAK